MEHLENFRLREIKQEIEAASGQIAEERLNQAIAKGLNRGKKRAIRRQIGFQVGIMAGLFTLSLFLLSNWGQDMEEWGHPPAQSVVQGSYGDIPEYVLSQLTSDMEAAAEHGLYQPVNRSEQAGPYQVTVDGILADQQQVYLFVTLTNLSGKSTPMELSDYHFVDPKRDLYPLRVTGPAFMSNDKYKTVQHLTYALSYATVPAGKIVFSGNMQSDRSSESESSDFEIPIEWNPDIYKDMKRTIALNQTEVIKGQSLTLNNLVLTPLATTLTVDTDPEAGTGIDGFINGKLILGRKQEGKFVQAIYPRDSVYRYSAADDSSSLSQVIFSNSIYYRDINEITFQASGITLNSYHPFEIKVDTDVKQLKSAPSHFTLLSSKENKAGEVEVQLQYNTLQPDDPDPLYFDINHTFLDQEGKQHQLLRAGYSNKVIMLTFDSLSFPQPLIFTGRQIEKEQIQHAMQWEFPIAGQ